MHGCDRQWMFRSNLDSYHRFRSWSNKETGSRVTRMDKIRNEYVHQRDSTGGTVLRENTKRQDGGGMDMYRGKMMGILGEECWGWNCQERGNGEGQNRCLWMWWKWTWQCLKWRRRMQKIGPNRDGKSAVATLDGRSRKKKREAKKRSGSQVLALTEWVVQGIHCTWIGSTGIEVDLVKESHTIYVTGMLKFGINLILAG